MARTYQHIKEYENEIHELKAQGATQCEIAERLGFTKEQVKGFFHRHHRKEREIAAEIPVGKQGHPSSRELNPETDKLSELRYILARKEARIHTTMPLQKTFSLFSKPSVLTGQRSKPLPKPDA